jgi:hypothetical protein
MGIEKDFWRRGCGILECIQVLVAWRSDFGICLYFVVNLISAEIVVPIHLKNAVVK